MVHKVLGGLSGPVNILHLWIVLIMGTVGKLVGKLDL